MSDQPVPEPVAPVPEPAPVPAAEPVPWKHPGAQDYVPTGVPVPGAKINGKPASNKSWMTGQHKAPGYHPVFHDEVAQLDKTALMPVVPVQPPSKLVLRAVNKLGLPKKNWDRAKIMAMQELAKFMTMKITARVLLVRNINTLEQGDMAMEWAKGILESTSKEITTEQKLAAMQMMTLAMKAIKDINAQQMELAEKGQDKISTDRPRNLPPQVNVQVNIPGGQPPGSPANSVSTGDPADIERE